MKFKFIILLIFPFALSFANKKSKNSINTKFVEQNLVLIKGGSMDISTKEDAIWKEYIDSDKKIKTNDFFIFNQEVSNVFYRYFVADYSKSDLAKIDLTVPDTLVWKNRFAYYDAYMHYYYKHPAYDNYPVVGVSKSQCDMFCEWLTLWYNSNPNRKFKKVIFKLPTHDQWIYAATSGNAYSFYPFESNRLTDKNGNIMANFTKINQESIRRDSVYNKVTNEKTTYYKIDHSQFGLIEMSSSFDLTAPVKSYYPSKLGLYNMAGNVAEYVSDSIITKGGSWLDPGYYLNNFVAQPITSKASADRGFRFVMEVIEY